MKPDPTRIKEKHSQKDTHPSSLPLNVISAKVRGKKKKKDQGRERPNKVRLLETEHRQPLDNRLFKLRPSYER